MVLILVSLVVCVIWFFLMQALSRYREFAADRGAALITGRPSALASALMRIAADAPDPAAGPARLERAERLLLLPAAPRSAISGLFATHPPMEKRIEALQRLEAQLQGRA